MKTMFSYLVGLSFLVTLGLALSGHLVIYQVNKPIVANIIGDDGKTVFQWQTGMEVFYRARFVK